MTTNLGTLLRRERVERDMLLGDLAKQLGISTPYLSMIETGQRPAKDDLVEKMIRVLGLSAIDANEFRRAAAQARTQYSIAIEDNATLDDRTLAAELALSFARLSPEAKEKLRKVLEEDRRG